MITKNGNTCRAGEEIDSDEGCNHWESSGLQFTGESGADSLEMIAPGEYFLRNGCHYVKYEEVIEGFGERNQNLVKISPSKLEVTKKGLTNIHMVFEENKKNLTCYSTPYGNLMIGIEGGPVSIQETDEQHRSPCQLFPGHQLRARGQL